MTRKIVKRSTFFKNCNSLHATNRFHGSTKVNFWGTCVGCKRVFNFSNKFYVVIFVIRLNLIGLRFVSHAIVTCETETFSLIGNKLRELTTRNRTYFLKKRKHSVADGE